MCSLLKLTPCPLHSWSGPPFSGLFWNWFLENHNLCQIVTDIFNYISSTIKHMFLEELFWSLFKCSPEGTSRNSLSPRDLYMSGSNRSCNKNHSCSFLEVRVSCLWSLKYQMLPIWKMQNILRSKPAFFTKHSHWSTFRKKISACSNSP